MGNIIVGIDIGTSKVCVIVARIDSHNHFTVLGKGLEYCSGVKKGIIVDIESTAYAIRMAVDRAEKISNVKIYSAYVNIMGTYTNLITNTALIDIADKKTEIRLEDVKKVFEKVQHIEIPNNKQIIDVIPKKYTVDSHSDIVDPIGMVGESLEIEADVVVADVTTVQNIVKSMERAGIRVDGIIVEPLATAQVILTEEEKEMGVVVLDVGGGITNISIFDEGEIVFCGAVNAGGDHITNDISIGLKISNTDAERLKKEYELALTSLIKNDQTISVHEVSEGKNKIVKASEIIQIIEERMSEIFSLSKNILEKFDLLKEYPGGIVLTGSGASYVEGCDQLAEQIFEMPVRVANYKKMGIARSDYLNAYGIVNFILSERKGYVNIASDAKLLNSEDHKKGNFMMKLIKFFAGAF